VGLYILSGIEFALIFTWVFNHTRSSVLLAILLHTSINVFQGVVNVLFPSQAGSEVNGLIGFGALALVLVFLTRGRLGYRDAETPTDTLAVTR
jgi:membrane protease YdiL (CAAX protease family)